VRADGKHEVATVLQRVSLADTISLAPAARLTVAGFAGDTLVGGALAALAEAAGVEPAWGVEIAKRIPVAGGLGGGSTDAATALRLANATLERPLPQDELHALAAALGADVPFFLTPGPQLGRGDGSDLSPVALPRDYWILLVLPAGAAKESTAAVYAAFDARAGADGFEARRDGLLDGLGTVSDAADLAALPGNDLASSPLAAELRSLGAFRADVSGAGPTLYGLFRHRPEADRARRELEGRGRTWICRPAW
jgi:4-diphosphocytidyl-2-C-methyl-D-erythritol kinase